METLNLDDNIYILLILGIVAVGAHAFTLFNQKLPVDETSVRWRFLNSIPIQLVTSRQKFNLGFLVYLLLFEFVYLILASSSSLVSMLYQLSGRESLTGALSDSVRPNGAIPILASTAIILFSQIRPFARFEQWVRAYTHQIASIPEGLRSVKFGVTRWLIEEQEGSGTRNHDGASSSEPVSTEAGASDLINPTDPDFVGRWARSVIADKRTAELFERSYRNVMLLSDYTLEATGSTLWDAAECEEILQIFRPTEHEVTKLRYDIKNAMEKVFPTDGESIKETLKSRDGDAPSDTDGKRPSRADASSAAASTKDAAATMLKPLIKQCMQLEERLVMLFSLLSINQPDANSQDDDRLSALLTAAHRRESNFITHLTMRTIVAGGFTALFLIFSYFQIEDAIRGTLRESPHITKAPYGSYVGERIASNLEAASHTWREGYELSERRVAARNAATFFDNTSQRLVASLKELAGILLLFGPAVMVTLAIRDQHVKTKQWADSSGRFKESLPIGKYYSACSYASLASLSMVFVFYFILLSLTPAIAHDKDVLSLDIIQPFIDFIPSLLSTALIAFVCGYYALYTFDLYSFSARQAEEERVADRKLAERKKAGRDKKAEQGKEAEKRNAGVPGKRLVVLAVYFSVVCAGVNLTTSLSIGTINSWWDVGQRVFIFLLGFLSLFLWFAWFTDRYHQPLGLGVSDAVTPEKQDVPRDEPATSEPENLAMEPDRNGEPLVSEQNADAESRQSIKGDPSKVTRTPSEPA